MGSQILFQHPDPFFLLDFTPFFCPFILKLIGSRTTIQNHLPNGKLENSTCLSYSLKVIVLTSIISQQNSYIEKDKDCAILGF